MRKKKTELRTKFLQTATDYLGYRSRPGGVSEFGKRVGYSGNDIPWSGSFIDVVARTAGVKMPAVVYSSSGLAEFAKSRRWRARPEPGDIVFYSFPTAAGWGSPHVGIVTETVHWNQYGCFKAIEAQVDSGLPKGSKDADGIYERLRWKYDVLAFCRPEFKERNTRAKKFRPAIENEEVQTGTVFVNLKNVRPGRKNKEVQTVQSALVKAVGLSHYDSGVFDRPTQAAYARWQRLIGFSPDDASGEPDVPSLDRLGRDTNTFALKKEN